MTTDSIHLPTPQDVIHNLLRRQIRTSAAFRLWGKIITATGAALGGGIAIRALTLQFTEMSLGTAVTLSLCMGGSLALGLAGTSMWVSGIFLRSDLAHYHAIQYDMESFAQRIKTSIDARPADAVALGELTAEFQANREQVRLMREDAAANERQRQSDFDLIRENSRKALDVMHDQIRRHDDEMYRGFAVVTENQISIHGYLKSLGDAIAASGTGKGLDPTDPKYLADMSECVRLGEEIAMRKLRPPDETDSK